MEEINTQLLTLQAGAMTLSAALAVMLYFSKFHQPDTSHTYENVRWMLILAMLIDAIHYWA